MPPMDLHQRRAVVTGAAQGIGRVIAARLLTAGAAVCLWDRAPEALTRTAHDLMALGTVAAVTVDVTDPAAVSAAVQATRARLGGIDILVNNAGIAGPNHPLWEYPLEAWRQVVEVNLLGTFYCCRAVVPVMLQSGYGRIINIASIAGKEGNPQASAYSASKAGVIGLTKSLGKELARHSILVNCVTPAAVETDLFQQMTPIYAGADGESYMEEVQLAQHAELGALRQVAQVGSMSFLRCGPWTSIRCPNDA